MFRIRVEKLLNKPIDQVFDALIDHENYNQFPTVDKSELLEHGKEEKNGLGALRKVELEGIKLEERIVAFERPTRLGYQIEKSSPLPFRHDIGQIDLKEEGDKTRVVWVSEGHINIPILGNLFFDKMINKSGSIGFKKTLNFIEQLA